MIYVDTSYFIGLFDKRDQWHKRAVELLEHLDKEPILISDLVISEIMTEIGKRKGGKAASMTYIYFTENCQVVFNNPEAMDAYEKEFMRFDGSISFTDASSCSIMKRMGVKEILSFDSDFDKIREIHRIH